MGLLRHLLLTLLGNSLCEVALSCLQSSTLSIQNGPIFQPADCVTAIICGDQDPRHLLWRVVCRGADHDPPGRSMMRGPTVLTSGHSSMASAGGSTPAGLGGHGPWFSGVRAPELATNRQGMPWIVAGLWSRCGRHLVHQTVFRHSAGSSSVLDLERVCNIGTCGLPRRVLAFQVFA
jgi:hypothetical protein